jgi:hypothetical protein
MALPASGAISLNQVNVELGLSGTTSINMNQATVRTLFGVASGAISMSNGYGKANQFSFSIASNTNNANLRTLAVNAGWDGTTKVVATLNSGIYFSSTAVGTAALTINGSWPGGVEFINNGTVVGDGGNGGYGGSSTAGGPGGGGGLALLVQSAVSVRNNGIIAGGGGGGSGGFPFAFGSGKDATLLGGGGGGGGRSGLTNSAGGAKGLSSGPYAPAHADAGGAGTVSSAGAGGAGGYGSGYTGYAGGAGGGWGATGTTGQSNNQSGGAGGAATSGSGSYITWLATGTRYGSIG